MITMSHKSCVCLRMDDFSCRGDIPDYIEPASCLSFYCRFFVTSLASVIFDPNNRIPRKRQSDERERSMSLIMDYVNGSSTLLHHQAFESTYDQLANQVLTYETARRNYYYLSNFLFSVMV